MSAWRERWSVSWSGVAIGALSAVALTLLFVTVVTSALAPVLALMPEFVGYGLMLLLVGCLRAVCGMWAAVRHRRRHRVDSRTEFFATAALAGAVGWAGWLLLTALAAHAVGGEWFTVRDVAEVLRWVGELVVGSLLVNPQPVQAADRLRGARRAGVAGRGGARW